MSDALLNDHDMAGTRSTGDYLAALKAHEASLFEGPWDLNRRGIRPERFYKRLASERDALLACLRDKRPVPVVHLLVVENDQAARQRCVENWRLQSHPHAPCEAVAAKDGQQLRECLLSVPPHDLVMLARGGDQFHPALATTLALRDTAHTETEQQVSAWSWNAVIRCGERARFIRKPGRSPMTLLGGDYVGRTIAVRAAVLRAAPEPVLAGFFAGSPALLAIWLAGQSKIAWSHHPETLSASITIDREPICAWRRQSAPIDALLGLASSLTGSHWEVLEAVPEQQEAKQNGRPVLIPPLGDHGHGVSVIIPFRDYIRETLRAVRALSLQVGCRAIEVILVNNGSSRESLANLDAGLQEFTESLQIRIIDYPWGFSHSRQCNLGVREASFGTVVILNNDAYLLSPDVLSDLIRWSNIPGVGTVGVQIVDESGALVCAGLKVRPRLGLDFESGFEESRDPLLSDALREVAGNTGACFAMKKDRYLALGGFDEHIFPVGMNDVEFCLRARRHGLTHISLGWLRVCHQAGTSRGATDELMQKIVLRERYPEISLLGQFQLGVDDHLSNRPWQRIRDAVAGGLAFVRHGSEWSRSLSARKSVPKNG